MAQPPAAHDDEAIRRLIGALAAQQPAFSSLGTPFLVDTETTSALVALGAAAVPALTTALGADATTAMYAAYCLGQIGDRSALPALTQMRDSYAAKDPKAGDDYGALSAARRAIELLSQ
jgi:HEAT repeat protein